MLEYQMVLVLQFFKDLNARSVWTKASVLKKVKNFSVENGKVEWTEQPTHGSVLLAALVFFFI